MGHFGAATLFLSFVVSGWGGQMAAVSRLLSPYVMVTMTVVEGPYVGHGIVVADAAGVVLVMVEVMSERWARGEAGE